MHALSVGGDPGKKINNYLYLTGKTLIGDYNPTVFKVLLDITNPGKWGALCNPTL